MNSYALKSRLLGLICICITSILLVGCAGIKSKPKTPSVPRVSEPFIPNHYIVKKNTQQDYDRLKRLLNSDNASEAASASAILGYYYLKDNNLGEASRYLFADYDIAPTDPYVYQLVNLWRMDLLVAQENMEEASKQAELIKAQEPDKYIVDALDTYCLTNFILTPEDAETYYCIDRKISNKGLYFETWVPTLQPLELSEGVLDILVMSKKGEYNFVPYYSIKNSIIHRIEFSPEFIEGNWDYIIDVDNQHLAIRGGEGLYFNPNVSRHLEKMDMLIDFSDCGKVVIGYGSMLQSSAQKLRRTLTDKGLYVSMIDISGSAARSVRSTMQKDWEQNRYCAVAVGSEDEINFFVPSVKQYQLRPSMQHIFILEPYESGDRFKSAYKDYYTNTTILTQVEENLSEEMKVFSAEYSVMIGDEPTYSALISHDMLHYINLHSVNGRDALSKYVTGVIDYYDGRAYRNIKAFTVNSSGDIEQIEINQIQSPLLEAAEALKKAQDIH